MSVAIFNVGGLVRYGREPGYDAFPLRVEGKMAGFVLVDERSPRHDGDNCHYITSFTFCGRIGDKGPARRRHGQSSTGIQRMAD